MCVADRLGFEPLTEEWSAKVVDWWSVREANIFFVDERHEADPLPTNPPMLLFPPA